MTGDKEIESHFEARQKSLHEALNDPYCESGVLGRNYE
tara:strand:+ start:37668 stop:37781 length:114 start_codon:yes stop_codon:yes gene_type:complete